MARRGVGKVQLKSPLPIGNEQAEGVLTLVADNKFVHGA